MPAIDPRNIEVVDPTQAKLFGECTVAERIAMIGAANRTARRMIEAGARSLNPDWTDEQIQAEVLRRISRGATGSLATGHSDAE